MQRVNNAAKAEVEDGEEEARDEEYTFINIYNIHDYLLITKKFLSLYHDNHMYNL